MYGTYYMDTTHHEPYTYEQSVTMISDKVDFSLPAELALPSGAVPGERYLQLIDDLNGEDPAKKKEAQEFLMRLGNLGGTKGVSNLNFNLKGTLAYRTVVVKIYRKNCNQLLDTLMINVQKDPNEFVPANSKEGFFKATLQKGTLEVQRVKEI